MRSNRKFIYIGVICLFLTIGKKIPVSLIKISVNLEFAVKSSVDISIPANLGNGFVMRFLDVRQTHIEDTLILKGKNLGTDRGFVHINLTSNTTRLHLNAP